MATTNGNFHHQEQYKASEGYASGAEGIPEQSTSGGANHDLSKDEVGWYFVEQYYTTLSKSPEKLHLFYGKRSQFVYGSEAEVANVSVGRQAIQERIKQLDFQECKVRVSNVDSLSSFDNIVIQVIGETSTKTVPGPRKFVQTFVLAKQPSGYFVLNDVWRYINDEEEEQTEPVTEEAAPADETTEVAAEPVAAEPASTEAVKAEQPKESAAAVSPGPEPDLVDKKLEEVAQAEEVSAAEKAKDAATESSKEGTQTAPSESGAAKEAADESLKVPEKPHEPTPTPSATKPKSPAAAAAAPAAPEPQKPAKPMTWASRAAAAAGTARPAPALPKTGTPPAAAQAKAPTPTAASKTAPAPQRSEAAPAAPDSSAATSSEWQTAGGDSKRQGKPQPAAAQPEKEGTLGYVKYVTEKVQDADLKEALSRYGSLTYFDINREKNCAFVEFASPEGYKAAVAANPHTVNGENILVEQRRPKSTAYGGAQYAANRGGASGRGRGRYDGGRTGSQGGPKAPFGGSTRGRGGGAPRGKSTQPANA